MTVTHASTPSAARTRTRVHDAERFSDAVVRLVAEARGCDPLGLEPIGDVVNADALDALFDPGVPVAAAATLTVTFSYAGRTVTVSGDDAEQICVVS
ncbi:MAG: HalOD1 output domain-containing protein [Haloarculaceae archaeon]